MKNDKEISERLYRVIKKKGFAVKEFADICEISQPNMSSYLNGNRPIGIKILNKIKEVIPELNINWLLYGENDPANHLNSYETNSLHESENIIERYIKDLISKKCNELEIRLKVLESDFKKNN
ncbi:MAG TPA: XRE family transcriptional regulator [Flavobacteriaceae bacterium]|nr:XRE family transcriptional regulator [Flavobacteriaceae bacterium]